MPYIGNVPLNQLSGQTVDKMFQDIIDKGLKPSTAAGAKRVKLTAPADIVIKKTQLPKRNARTVTYGGLEDD